VAPVLPVLGAAHHLGGRVCDLGGRRPRPRGAGTGLTGAEVDSR
jgi:hypothetical protein